MSIYLKLTEEFNQSRTRAVICSGQAVVLHRLAVMSKDGDWILREDEETVTHILSVLEEHGALYRFGAPLDLAWLGGGWSSHFEFHQDGLRVRTDFFTRPPRLSEAELKSIWENEATSDPPFTAAPALARIKMTQREKDYPIIGELTRIMTDPTDQFRFSRSPRDLIKMARENPGLAGQLAAERSLLELALGPEPDEDELGAALDAERRQLMKADRDRMARYESAARAWREKWPQLKTQIEDLPLRQAHEILVKEATRDLPAKPR